MQYAHIKENIHANNICAFHVLKHNDKKESADDLVWLGLNSNSLLTLRLFVTVKFINDYVFEIISLMIVIK